MARTLWLVALAACLAPSSADPASLACPLRQVGVDYARKLQPFRTPEVFQELADALNGAPDGAGCAVTAGTSPADAAASRALYKKLPTSGLVVFADPTSGDDTAAGSITAPLRTLHAAVARLREQRRASNGDAPATIVLRAGTFHEGRTLELTAADSFTTFQAFPDEVVFISGAVPVTGVTWTPATPPARALYEYKAGALGAGFDMAPAGMYTLAAAQAFCTAAPTCAGFTYDSADPSPSGPVNTSFKYAAFWAPAAAASSYFKNDGYLAGAQNLWVADVSAVGLERPVDALRADGGRYVRARYPNARTVEQLGAMQLLASKWTAQSQGTTSASTATAPLFRNESINDGKGEQYFAKFVLGIGGPCTMRFTPQAAYWCANYTQGGGPGPYQAPVGMTVSNTVLPHTPYASGAPGAVVHSWRAGRWFSWAFVVDSTAWSPSDTSTYFNFSLEVGGNQGSRGGDAGQEFMIENVLEELDAPGEFFYDSAAKKLYVWYNASGAPGPRSIEAPQMHRIISAIGNQSAPVRGVGFSGIGFRDSAPSYLEPMGTPSGGDWAIPRTGALFFEGTEATRIDGCLLLSLDGPGVFFSGYNRFAEVTRNEFFGIGETAVMQWGFTDGSPVPGMGYDATAGNQPRGTRVTHNYVHEVGLWTKQNSFYFQSESFGNVIEANIAFNGPRAGINFDDGMGGNSSVTGNVLANFCRESSDHGPFNSWNRQVYLFDGPDGKPTTLKANDSISFNWILANYHSSMAIDNDDGSSHYDTHDNVFISASSGAAYGGNSLKSDFGGHSNYHYRNMDLFFSEGFGICGQLEGFEDGYWENTLYMGKDGAYGGGQTCSGPGMTVVHDNTVYSPTGAITECGMTLAKWQAAGGDPGTTAAVWPADSVIITQARALLGV